MKGDKNTYVDKTSSFDELLEKLELLEIRQSVSLGKSRKSQIYFRTIY